MSEDTNAREEIALWMLRRGYAIGHGDTIEDLLVELEGEAKRRERLECAAIIEGKTMHDSEMRSYADYFAGQIRARERE